MGLRRVVLLSDGTGNSSAQVWRTNVWRMFSALDLTNDEQVACYDDGIGTSSFKPLALLGGAFGVGLRRNVISLYKFACRNYRSGDDEIYAFGFSRGAFTIRVTIGFILDQGLVVAEGKSETELDGEARQAYRAYHKRHFHTNWWLMYHRLRQLIGILRRDICPSKYELVHIGSRRRVVDAIGAKNVPPLPSTEIDWSKSRHQICIRGESHEEGNYAWWRGASSRIAYRNSGSSSGPSRARL